MFDITQHVCRTCGGEGEIDTIEWVQCAACGGDGHILGEKCESCEGHCRQLITVKKPCPVCGEPGE